MRALGSRAAHRQVPQQVLQHAPACSRPRPTCTSRHCWRARPRARLLAAASPADEQPAATPAQPHQQQEGSPMPPPLKPLLASSSSAAADAAATAAAAGGAADVIDDLTADDNIILLLGSEDEEEWEEGGDEEYEEAADEGYGPQDDGPGLSSSSSSSALRTAPESAAAFAAAMAAARQQVLSGSSSGGSSMDEDGEAGGWGAQEGDPWDTPVNAEDDFWSTERERVYLVGVAYKQQYQQQQEQQQQRLRQQRQQQRQQQPSSLFGGAPDASSKTGSSNGSSSGPRGGLGMALPAASAAAVAAAGDLDGGNSGSGSIGSRRRRRQEVTYSVEESLEELGRLAETAGLQVVGSTHQALEAPNNATYIGSGKVAEVAAAVAALKADTVLFDDELSPGQLRNLEKAFSGGQGGRPVAVADRTALILDIFSQRARTREGKLQVQLAQTEYQLPRLSRMWTHLDRVAGGGQVKGVGEKQIEIDKRLLRDKAAALRRELEAVRTHRAAHRTRRQDAPIPVVALVGYTNAGKSTLLNTLTDAGVLAEDKLFATLDPTTRKVRLEGNLELLVSDTVGFIQKLPTQLVAAFRATLEEIAAAAVVVHVLDVSAPNAAAQCSAVLQVLEELGVQDLPMITAWNKVDACPDPAAVAALAATRPDVVAVSGASGTGLDALLAAVGRKLQESMQQMQVLLPYSQGALLDELHKMGKVADTQYTEAGTLLTASVPRCLVGKLQAYSTGGTEQYGASGTGGTDGGSWQQGQQQSLAQQLAGHQLPPEWSQLVLSGGSSAVSSGGSSSSSSSMASL